MRLDDLDQWTRRAGRKKFHRGQPVRWFERYGPAGTRIVHKAMLNNRLAKTTGTKSRRAVKQT